MLDAVDPREQLRDRDVEHRRDLAIEVDLHQQADELARFVDEHARLTRAPDDLVGEEAPPFRDYDGGGIALRVWAVRTLGPRFRTVVMIDDDHQLITTGPYRLLRHPSYAGSVLTLAGIGVALGNGLSLLLAVFGALIGFTRRIQIEEAALQTRFGTAYTAWAQRTWRLVPFMW